MIGFRLLIMVSVTFALAACSGSPTKRLPPNLPTYDSEQGGNVKIGKPYKIAGQWYYPSHQPYYDEVGVASWYGPNFHGKKTANGETFNMNALTAAHKTLAMPTHVKVSNLENGRSIILRVNDRGPYVGTRVIDVSRRGAQILGFLDKGKTKVRVQAVDSDGNLRQKPYGYVKNIIKEEKAGHYVQLGAYASHVTATEVVGAANRKGTEAKIQKTSINGTKYYRVRVGPFNSRNIAERILDTIVSRGFHDARVTSDLIH